MDPRRILAALNGADMSDDGGGDAPPARPDMRAQRLELRARFDGYEVWHEFRSGELVAEKDGHSVFDQKGGGRALIFWRWLEPKNPVDAHIIRRACERERVNAVDCIVGTIEDGHDGLSCVVFHSHDSARLRRLTAEEQAELDAINGGKT